MSTFAMYHPPLIPQDEKPESPIKTAEPVKTSFESFWGKTLQYIFVGPKVLASQEKNWEQLIENAGRISLNPNSTIAPSDPAWMQIHGIPYAKYIENLASEHPHNLMQDLYTDTFNQSVEDVKETVKEVADGTRWDFRLAVAGLALLVIFNLLRIFK